MIDLDKLAKTVLTRLDTDEMELGSAHEMLEAHGRGVPYRSILRFKYSDILPEDSLAEAIRDALHEQDIDYE